MDRRSNHFTGNGRNFNIPPPNVDSSLPVQQLRYMSREDAMLREDLRKTRKKLTEMEQRINDFEGQLRPGGKWPHGGRRPYEAPTNYRSHANADEVTKPDIPTWLAQQRRNCELWNQNFALKECLRNIMLENNILKEMCRQKELNISLLEKKTLELKADLKFHNDVKHDIKLVSNAFNIRPAKEVEMSSYKCTCGQC
ncbi:unnamed protein product [Heligmosomoides polygyrus]|uniref:Tektin n=1 Tax=Heligmosomoides polygyrus TaxID=6339 RepID=A0A183F370_HELPZ|nr:unnamed protein product [Heligmosomoides polygyrus]